jgi:hypothetical protein
LLLDRLYRGALANPEPKPYPAASESAYILEIIWRFALLPEARPYFAQQLKGAGLLRHLPWMLRIEACTSDAVKLVCMLLTHHSALIAGLAPALRLHIVRACVDAQILMGGQDICSPPAKSSSSSDVTHHREAHDRCVEAVDQLRYLGLLPQALCAELHLWQDAGWKERWLDLGWLDAGTCAGRKQVLIKPRALCVAEASKAIVAEEVGDLDAAASHATRAMATTWGGAPRNEGDRDRARRMLMLRT